MRKHRTYLPATQAALSVLGAQIAVGRRELGWTAAALAERLGVTPELVAKIEKGAPSTAIGTAFEAAILVGVPLLAADPSDLPTLADAQRAKLALLPARVRTRAVEVSDDF